MQCDTIALRMSFTLARAYLRSLICHGTKLSEIASAQTMCLPGFGEALDKPLFRDDVDDLQFQDFAYGVGDNIVKNLIERYSPQSLDCWGPVVLEWESADRLMG